MGVCVSKIKEIFDTVNDNMDEIATLGEDVEDIIESVLDDAPISEVIENIKDAGENTIDLIK